MGVVRHVKAAALATDANQARLYGRHTFVAKMNYPITKLDFSGEVIDWSVMIEAVETQGWFLSSMTAYQDKQGRPELICLFRLRQQ